MPLFGPRRKRPARAAKLKPPSAWAAWLREVFPGRQVLAPVLLTAIALIAMTLAVQAWQAPFTWRIGDRPSHGVSARVAFQQLDERATEEARRDAAEAVPPVFLHEPAPLSDLSDQLRASLNNIARANELGEVPENTRKAFGLVPPPEADDEGPQTGNQGEPGTAAQGFQILKAFVAAEDAPAGRRIDDLVAEFRKFIEPLIQHGRIDESQLEQLEVPADRYIIVQEAGTGRRSQVWPHEVLLAEAVKDTGVLGKQWQRFPELVPARGYLERWLLSQVPVTLRYSEQATQQARDEARRSVTPVYHTFNRWEQLVKPRQLIDADLLAILRAEYQAVEDTVEPGQRAARVLLVLLMLLLLAILMGYYLVRNEPRLIGDPSRLSVFLLAIVASVALSRLFSFDPWRAELVFLLMTVTVLAIAYNQQLAILTALMLSVVITLCTRADLGQFVSLIGVSAAAIIPLSAVASRSTLIKVGFLAGAVFFVLKCGVGMVETQSFTSVWSDWNLLKQALRGAGWCLLTGFIVSGSLPFVEKVFGVVTDISLLEMSDVSHPLLQELVRRAPGTYNHSMTVATIGETAADAIGANGLLVRVGAYFHDIGKMLKPEYFVENMSEGEASRHEKLAPAMSTLIIIGHVKDGADLARRHNLPPSIIDFIEQHHGTTLVEYFYHEAARLADLQPGHRTDAEESSFRYPGPKPQTREAGVMMLADAVESASRTLEDPTPRRIETLVKQISMKRLLDDQFDECGLTLSEIRIVEESLIKSLIAIYHGRIKYPEQRAG